MYNQPSSIEQYSEQPELTAQEQMSNLFTVMGQLGQGAFGKVFECVDRTDGQRYAVKVIQKNSVKKSKIEFLRQQAKIMSAISHPNIVKLYSMTETEGRFYLRMELIQHGTLAKLMSDRAEQNLPFPEQDIARIMRSLFQGVGYLHSLNIIHRDLKPCMFLPCNLENIMVSDPNNLSCLKITDFGLSTQLDSQRSTTLQCGTLIYMAPQILFRSTYTKSVDIYSCSVIMFMLFNRNRHPVYEAKMGAEEYRKRIAHARFPSLGGEYALAENFLQRISKFEALERYNVVEALRHPWITRRFEDQVPLSIYQSFLSFQHVQRMMLMMRMAFVVSCGEGREGGVGGQASASTSPPFDSYDKQYLERVRKYNEISGKQKQKRNNDRKQHKKKVNSAEHIKDLFGEYERKQKERQRASKQQEIYNDKHPKIQKLNSMFSNLFQKKTKNPQTSSKIQTMGNLASFEQPKNPTDPDNNKQKIQQQIQKSVRDFKDKQVTSHKSRRIFSRNNLNSKKPETLPAINSKTSMGDHANLSTNQHDSSFKSNDRVRSKGKQQLRNRTTVKLKEGGRPRRGGERKPSVNVRK